MVHAAALACALAAAWTFATAAQDGAAPAPRPDPRIESLRKGERGSYEAAIAAGEELVPPLLALLSNKNEAAVPRFMAANVLGEIASERAVDGLTAALSDEEPSVRRCSALALGWIGDPRAKAPLEKLSLEDPYAWTDPETKEQHYLVRDDAKEALALLARVDRELADASRPPELRLACKLRKVAWPFRGGFREQNLFNNYSQPTDAYVHAGLDLMHDHGTEVRAVEGGWIRLVATNYPEWKTHHYFVVATEEGGDEGFSYTHVDPDTYRFKVGDRVAKGDVLGKLVDFSVGENDGADHLHLDYVKLELDAKGKLEPRDLADPLLFLDYEDSSPPLIEPAVRFVRDGSYDEFEPGAKGVATVRGRVDVIAGLSDKGWPEQGCNWGVPVVTLEIVSVDDKGVAPWRKLVLDMRGEVGDERASSSVFVPSAEAELWDKPFWVHWTVLTNTDGDGKLERDDRRFAWNTRAKTAAGAARFPDGTYEVIVRAWDLAGNAAERRAKIRVANGG
jgi:hypothetical protein